MAKVYHDARTRRSVLARPFLSAAPIAVCGKKRSRGRFFVCCDARLEDASTQVGFDVPFSWSQPCASYQILKARVAAQVFKSRVNFEIRVAYLLDADGRAPT
jgi:hypothetical protein